MRRMPKRRRGRKRLWLEALEPRVVLDGESGGVVAETPTEGSVWERFDSDESLQRYLVDIAVQRWGGLFGTEAPRWPWVTLAGGVGTDRLVSTSANFDGTNVQVAGIDEGDVVKTDGRYLYIANQGRLSIVDAEDASNLRLTSQIALEGWTHEIHLSGDRLAVISVEFNVVPLMLDLWQPPPVSNGPQTTVSVFDVSDRAAPTLLSETTFDGWLKSSRRIGETIYLVADSDLAIPAPELICETGNGARPDPAGTGSESLSRLFAPTFPWPEPGQLCVYETQEQYLARVATELVTLVLPTVEVTDATGAVVASGFLSEPDEVYKPITESPHHITSILAFDLSATVPAPHDSVSVLTDYASTVYVSSEHIYVTSNTWNEQGATTHLLQFSIGGEEAAVELRAIGSVPGTLLNQFSLDEYAGHLRVVTSNGWGENRQTSLHVMRTVEGRLNTVGSIDGIAPGESVFAARFLGDQAFLVTFRQIDPLFSIDLSDPAHPAIVDELKIPGFSSYLHPAGNGLLIGFGREGDRFDSPQQLSLFDVSDLAALRRIDQILLDDQGGSWSEALYNHHAFSFFPDSGVLVVPIEGGYRSCSRETGACSETAQHRFIVARIEAGSEDPLRLLGEIAHDSQPLRSLRIGDRLFTISEETVKARDLLDPGVRVGELHFGRLAVPDHLTVDLSSERVRLDVLANDRAAAGATIVSVGRTSAGGSVVIAENGKSVIYSPPSDRAVLTDSFTYTLANQGRTDTASVEIELTWDQVQRRMVELARRDLAERLGIPVDAIQLATAHRQTWPDACLGAASPETACAQVLTPGFRIVLVTGTGTFTYHTDAQSQLVLAESWRRSGPAEETGEAFPGDGPVVRIRAEIVDREGNPVSMLRVGDEAALRIYARDLRDETDRQGVWAAYADVEFPADMVAEIGPIDHGEVLRSGVSGELAERGRLRAVGGFDVQLSRPVVDEVLVATIPFVATRVGGLQFSTRPAGPQPLRDSLVRGADVAVPSDRIEFGQVHVEVAARWHNKQRPTDTNEDGSTSPLDALLVFNHLHAYGPERLGAAASLRAMGESATRAPFKIDVNGDDYASPLDALLVINALQPQALHAAGEAVAERFTGEPERTLVLSRIDGSRLELGPRTAEQPPLQDRRSSSPRRELPRSESVRPVLAGKFELISRDLVSQRMRGDSSAAVNDTAELDLFCQTADESWWLP